MSTSNHETDMDSNHRGGPPGFVRVVTNDHTNGTVLAYPEYSGNRLYQSLGNLQVNPNAGLVFPDFTTGDVLYVTGEAKILVGKDAEELLPHTNLVVEIRVLASIHVKQGFGFSGASWSTFPIQSTCPIPSRRKKLRRAHQPSGEAHRYFGGKDKHNPGYLKVPVQI